MIWISPQNLILGPVVKGFLLFYTLTNKSLGNASQQLFLLWETIDTFFFIFWKFLYLTAFLASGNTLDKNTKDVNSYTVYLLIHLSLQDNSSYPERS